jgi:hypothetical protein
MCRMKKKLYIALIVLIILTAGGIIGWLARGGGKPDQPKAVTPQASQTQGVGNQADKSSLKSLVGYTLPDGWQEASCDGRDAVYVLPHEVSLNCSADPSAPISLSSSPQSATDCSQLDSQPNVRQHVCKSLNIDGRKTLQASTTAADGNTVADYYMDTGKGVVRVEYRYSGTGTYLEQYDQIAKSLVVK